MGTATADPALPLRVVTFNVRYATASPLPNEQPWPVRAPRLCAQLAFVAGGAGRPAFLCLQEVLHAQLLDIRARLGPAWAHVGVGRGDGARAGEFSPVLYRADAWDLERGRTYWLSPTPDRPSRGWDAALERVVTAGRFRHRATGARVVVMSTHFDHVGEVAREQSARLILRIAAEWAGAGAGAPGGLPVFLGGDFNSTPEGRAYRVMTAEGSGVRDVAALAPEAARYGNVLTYTSFGEPGQAPKRIDFLFAREAARVECRAFGVLCNRFDDGVYLSDHRAVVADVEVPTGGGAAPP